MDRVFKDMPSIMKSLFSFIDIPGMLKLGVSTSGAILGYIAPEKAQIEALIGALLLVGIDTATGIIAAFINNEPRSSRKLSKAFSKLFGYLSVVIVGAVASKTLAQSIGGPLITGILWLIIATEGLSIIENVERMGTGKFTFLRKILGKVLDDEEAKGE